MTGYAPGVIIPVVGGERLPVIVLISGAGTEEVNGLYFANPSREYNDAPVYEHDTLKEECLISREAHVSAKTQEKKHGWLLGLKKQPLYGSPTEDRKIPEKKWKKFGGAEPVPSVQAFLKKEDAFFVVADRQKAEGNGYVEKEEFVKAIESYNIGIDALKRSKRFYGEEFTTRAAHLLGYRAEAQQKNGYHRLALIDSIAALEITRGMSSAEERALQCARKLGCTAEQAKQLLEGAGTGAIIDFTNPLILRGVERWVDTALDAVKSDGNLIVPARAVHLEEDRYLQNMDDKTREKVFDIFTPKKDSTSMNVVDNASECLRIMSEWETIFNKDDFQARKKQLWDQKELSYPQMMKKLRELIAEFLGPNLTKHGYAPDQNGLTRIVGQMQKFWSQDKNVAHKAEDLEDVCDVSIADLAM